MFLTNKKYLFKELNSAKTNGEKGVLKPNKDDVRRFWNDLWTQEREQSYAQWLKDVQEEWVENEEQLELGFTNRKCAEGGQKD